MRLPRFIWYLFARLLVSFSEIGIPFFLWSCKHVALIRKYARSYRALELMYTYTSKKTPNPILFPDPNENSSMAHQGIKETFFTNFWERNVDNAREVRSRLAITKKELHQAISIQRQIGHNIHILSVGSGSARAVIEVLAENHKNGVKATLLDISRSALRYSEELAKNFRESLETCRVNIFQFLPETERKFQIVEMVGLAEYIEEEALILLLENIWDVLAPGGILIFSHIAPNKEMDFISVIVGWIMIYRTKEEIKRIVANTPFKKIERCISTPLGIHHLYVLRKT